MPPQRELIEEFAERDGMSWVLFLDAGRADIFEELYEDYMDEYDVKEKSYTRANNGNVPSTPLWFRRNWDWDVPGHLFHAGQSIQGITGPDYNEFDHFAHVPSETLYSDPDLCGDPEFSEGKPWVIMPPYVVNCVVKTHLPQDPETVQERLEALGYAESSGGDDGMYGARSTGRETRVFDINVVRYLQPHTPYRTIEEFGAHRQGFEERIQDPDSGWTRQDLIDAYTDNYRWAMDYSFDLAELLLRDYDSNVVITADHGECFGDCGEWHHGSGLHDHMVNVPWLEVEI